MKPRRLVILITGLSLAVVLAYGGYTRVRDKATDLRHRFQVLETKIKSIENHLASALVKYQASQGKAVFGAPATPSILGHGKWEQVGGDGINNSWKGNYYSKTKALAVYRGHIVVGLLGPKHGDALIWQFDGDRWTIVGGDGRSGSWSKLRYVQVLKAHKGTLYAGVDNQVWRLRDGHWQRLWQAKENVHAYSMAIHGGELYVGLTGAPEVYRHDGKRWFRIAAGKQYSGIYELWSHDDGFLYAGMIAPKGPTSVYRLRDGMWEKIGGAGVRGSWINPGFTYILSFASYQGKLVVSMNRDPLLGGDFSSVWSFDGKSWQPVGLGSIPTLWSEMPNYNALVSYNGRLYVSAGGHPAGNTSLWELSKTGTWRQVAGHGLGRSWGGKRHQRMSPNRHSPSEYIYRLVELDGQLYAGFGDSTGMAQIWRYSPQK